MVAEPPPPHSLTMRLVRASANPDKVAESRILGDAVELVPRPASVADVVEDSGYVGRNAGRRRWRSAARPGCRRRRRHRPGGRRPRRWSRCRHRPLRRPWRTYADNRRSCWRCSPASGAAPRRPFPHGGDRRVARRDRGRRPTACARARSRGRAGERGWASIPCSSRPAATAARSANERSGEGARSASRGRPSAPLRRSHERASPAAGGRSATVDDVVAATIHATSCIAIVGSMCAGVTGPVARAPARRCERHCSSLQNHTAPALDRWVAVVHPQRLQADVGDREASADRDHGADARSTPARTAAAAWRSAVSISA